MLGGGPGPVLLLTFSSIRIFLEDGNEFARAKQRTGVSANAILDSFWRLSHCNHEIAAKTAARHGARKSRPFWPKAVNPPASDDPQVLCLKFMERRAVQPFY